MQSQNSATITDNMLRQVGVGLLAPTQELASTNTHTHTRSSFPRSASLLLFKQWTPMNRLIHGTLLESHDYHLPSKPWHSWHVAEWQVCKMWVCMSMNTGMHALGTSNADTRHTIFTCTMACFHFSEKDSHRKLQLVQLTHSHTKHTTLEK